MVLKHFELYLKLIRIAESLSIFFNGTKKSVTVFNVIAANKSGSERNHSVLFILSNEDFKNSVFPFFISFIVFEKLI
jgi:hypothetical protein